MADVAARRQALDLAPDPGFDPDAWRRAKEAADARQEAALDLAGPASWVAQADAERGLAKQALARADQADARAAALDAEAALGPADAVLAGARERSGPPPRRPPPPTAPAAPPPRPRPGPPATRPAWRVWRTPAPSTNGSPAWRSRPPTCSGWPTWSPGSGCTWSAGWGGGCRWRARPCSPS